MVSAPSEAAIASFFNMIPLPWPNLAALEAARITVGETDFVSVPSCA